MATVSGTTACGYILPPGHARPGKVTMLFDRLDPAAVMIECETDAGEFGCRYTLALDLLTQAVALTGQLMGQRHGTVQVRSIGGTVTLLLATTRGQVVVAVPTVWMRTMLGSITLVAGSRDQQATHYQSLIEAEIADFLNSKQDPQEGS